MDFSTIRKKLSNGAYANLEQFEVQAHKTYLFYLNKLIHNLSFPHHTTYYNMVWNGKFPDSKQENH